MWPIKSTFSVYCEDLNHTEAGFFLQIGCAYNSFRDVCIFRSGNFHADDDNETNYPLHMRAV